MSKGLILCLCSWMLIAGQKEAYLGVGLATFNKSAKKSWVYVYNIMPGSGAEDAGVKVKDRIVSLEGQPVAHLSDIDRIMDTLHPGDSVNLEVRRGRKNLKLQVLLGEMPTLSNRLAPILGERFSGIFSMGHYWLGFRGIDISDQLAAKMNTPKGILINEVFPEGPGMVAGIQAGDLLISVEGESVASLAQVGELLSTYKEGSLVELTVLRDKKEQRLSMKMVSLGDAPSEYREDILKYINLNQIIEGAIELGESFEIDN